MNVAEDINRIVASAEAEANAALEVDDFAEAKRALAGAVRDLRDLKRQLTDQERSVRESYQDAKLKARGSGQTVGLFVGSKMRGAMARGRAAEGRRLSANQANALRPYAHAKAEIDRAISVLDRAKAQVTSDAADAKESRPSRSATTTPAVVEAAAVPEIGVAIPVASPPPPPPAWAADPTGRHEHRYWDGAAWTHHVANGGVASTDPM